MLLRVLFITDEIFWFSIENYINKRNIQWNHV